MDILNPVGSRNPNQTSGEGEREDEIVELKSKSYVEGAQSIPLPSKGVFYTWDPKLIGIETLKVRELNYSDEDILTTKSYLEDGSVFLELLKNVIIDENNFTANGLVPIDRDTILLWLRSTSFGNEFEAEVNCPNCSEKNKIVWNLSSFKIPEYSEEVLSVLKEKGEYSFRTPLRDLKVSITVPTIGRQKEYEKLLEAKKKNNKLKTDLYGMGSVMLIISSVEELETGKVLRRKSEIESYFAKINLPISDARYIRKQLEKISLVYDTKQSLTCTNCEYTQEGIEMPMLHPNFFWPDTGV